MICSQCYASSVLQPLLVGLQLADALSADGSCQTWLFMMTSLPPLTRERYLKFRHMYIQSFSASSPSHHEPYKHQVKKEPQRKAFFSQKEEISDDDEYANAEEQFSTDPESEEHSPYSVY